MRVLIIAAWTMPALRPQSILLDKLIRFLSKKNINIKLLTLTKDTSYKNVEVIEYQYINKYINALLKRILTVDSWFYNKIALHDGVKKSCKIIKNENIDLILCFANPYFVNVIGALVKQKTKVPLLIHYSDPFTHNPFKKISKYQLNKWKAAEDRVVSVADDIVFVNKQLKEYVCKNSPVSIADKSLVIPHSYEQRIDKKKSKVINGDKFIIRHIGSIYGERKINTLIEALQMIKAKRQDVFKKLIVEMVGSELLDSQSNRLIEIIPDELSDTLIFKEKVSYEKSLELINSADAVLCIDANCKEKIFLPSKLIEYFGASVPILCVTSSGTPSHEILSESEIKTADINSSKDIMLTILNIFESKEEYIISSNKEEYSIENIGGKWLELFDKNLKRTNAYAN